jgi:hypothetical protein
MLRSNGYTGFTRLRVAVMAGVAVVPRHVSIVMSTGHVAVVMHSLPRVVGASPEHQACCRVAPRQLIDCNTTQRQRRIAPATHTRRGRYHASEQPHGRDCQNAVHAEFPFHVVPL